MDYWALGHIHKPEIVLSDPLSVYAGCPQGLDPTQSGERGCWLVDVTEGLPSAQFIPLAPVVWDEAVVPCDELATVDDVRAALAAAADAARERADGVPVVLRIDLQGDTPAHDSLAVAGALEALVDDVRAEALSVEPWVWLDRVRDRTRPQLDLQALRRHEDFAGDVVRLADELLARPANAQALLDEVLAPLLARLGAGDAPDLDALDVVARARDRLLDRLRGEASR